MAINKEKCQLCDGKTPQLNEDKCISCALRCIQEIKKTHLKSMSEIEIILTMLKVEKTVLFKKEKK